MLVSRCDIFVKPQKEPDNIVKISTDDHFCLQMFLMLHWKEKVHKHNLDFVKHFT